MQLRRYRRTAALIMPVLLWASTIGMISIVNEPGDAELPPFPFPMMVSGLLCDDCELGPLQTRVLPTTQSIWEHGCAQTRNLCALPRGSHLPLDYPSYPEAVAPCILQDDVQCVKTAVTHNPSILSYRSLLFHSSILDSAIMLSASHVVTYLMTQGFDPNEQRCYGDSALHVVAGTGNIAIAQILLRNGAIIDLRNDMHRTPLSKAVMLNDMDIASLLIQSGGNVNVFDVEWSNPICDAVKLENLAMVNLLLQNGAMANHGCGRGGSTPLYHAIEHGSVEIAEALIEYRGGHEPPDPQTGMTVLHLSILNRSYQLLSDLLSAGADVDGPDCFGRTPLHMAVQTSYTNGIHILLERGALVDATDNRGRTPLHYAAVQCSLSLIRALRIYGGELYARDDFDTTPLDITLRCPGLTRQLWLND